jgi:hypothetical protein
MTSVNPKFNGLSDEQVLRLFEQIATTISLVCELCREQAEIHGTEEVAYTFHAMDTMLRGVGALADHATGGDCIGDFAAWMLGPMFHQTQAQGATA